MSARVSPDRLRQVATQANLASQHGRSRGLRREVLRRSGEALAQAATEIERLRAEVDRKQQVNEDQARLWKRDHDELRQLRSFPVDQPAVTSVNAVDRLMMYFETGKVGPYQ